MYKNKYQHGKKGYGSMVMQGRIDLSKDCRTEEEKLLFKEANKLLLAYKKGKKQRKIDLIRLGIVDKTK